MDFTPDGVELVPVVPLLLGLAWWDMLEMFLIVWCAERNVVASPCGKIVFVMGVKHRRVEYLRLTALSFRAGVPLPQIAMYQRGFEYATFCLQRL